MMKKFDLERTKELLARTQQKLEEADTMISLIRAEIAAMETPLELALQAVSKLGEDEAEELETV